MRKRKYFLVSGLILASILTGVGSYAANQDNTGMARGRAGFARFLGARGFVRGLNLTDDQKTQIKGILQSNKTQILQTARDVAKGRLDLMNGVSGATTELANAQLAAANLRGQILTQIEAVLTPDQVAKVQERQQLRKQRLQKALDRLNSKIGG